IFQRLNDASPEHHRRRVTDLHRIRHLCRLPSKKMGGAGLLHDAARTHPTAMGSRYVSISPAVRNDASKALNCATTSVSSAASATATPGVRAGGITVLPGIASFAPVPTTGGNVVGFPVTSAHVGA